MTMLTLVQHFCERQNLPVPTTVYGSTDKQVTQIKALLEEVGNDLSKRSAWNRMIFEASLTTTATESQGLMTTLCPTGFNYIINETIWSRTRRLPVCGPLSPQAWETLKALFVNGPYYQYRIRGGQLLVNPTPPANESWYFEYVTNYWITDSVGTTYKEFFTADTDLTLLPEDLLLSGLRWAWLAAKGMDYAELFRTYEMQVKDAIGRDGSKPRLSMDNTYPGRRPGIFVSPGSWPL